MTTQTATTERQYAVYTKDLIETGMRPYIVSDISASSVASKFFRKYGVSVVKVIPCSWNPETGDYEPEAK